MVSFSEHRRKYTDLTPYYEDSLPCEAHHPLSLLSRNFSHTIYACTHCPQSSLHSLWTQSLWASPKTENLVHIVAILLMEDLK